MKIQFGQLAWNLVSKMLYYRNVIWGCEYFWKHVISNKNEMPNEFVSPLEVTWNLNNFCYMMRKHKPWNCGWKHVEIWSLVQSPKTHCADILSITVNSVFIFLITIINVFKYNKKNPSKIDLSLPSETEYKRKILD